jgi:hypothetical protein
MKPVSIMAIYQYVADNKLEIKNDEFYYKPEEVPRHESVPDDIHPALQHRK